MGPQGDLWGAASLAQGYIVQVASPEEGESCLGGYLATPSGC